MDAANLYSVLANKDGGFVGIGKVTAERLLAAFEPDELLTHIREQNSEALRQVKGVGDKAILGLYRGYMVLSKKLELAEALDRMGLRKANINKIYSVWGNQALQKIKKNPYQLLFVLSWEQIDPIGLKLGDKYHPCRLIAAVENCMYDDYEQDKNTCISPSRLLEKVSGLLACGIDIAKKAVGYAIQAKAILQYKNIFQIPAAYSFERQTESLLRNNRKYDISPTRVTLFLQREGYQSLTEEQTNVVINSLENHVSAFYGRGGRGKTFTLSAICDAAGSAHLMGSDKKTLSPILCAVAAKACQRMRKETGREAMTIAKVLYKVERRDLEQKIILVDEASMLSLSDAYHLIKKIPDSSRLVFLGDAGQIPSIDAGRFLYDLIKSKVVPSVELTINQRQDEKTDKQLECILNATFPEFEDFMPGAGTGLYRAMVKNLHEAEEKAKELYALFRGNAQILSPLKKHAGGSDSINTLIHEEHHYRRGFCKGTPVIYTKNMTLKTKIAGRGVSLTNGSMGVVVEVLSQNPRFREPYLKVDFDFEGEVILTWAEATEHLQMAYCLTCHKAQGSDWETVIIVLPKSDKMIDRNMIYTALSRCKVRAILIYFDHKYVEGRVRQPAAHERRRSALFGGGNA